MKIVIATPIYLPEIGGPPIYIKELVTRLATEHEVTVITYSDNPDPLPAGTLITISKSTFLPIRLYHYYRAVKKAAREAEVIYAQNAVAAGLPALLAARHTGTRIVLKIVGDEAWERAYGEGRTKKLLLEFLSKPEGGFKTVIFRKIQKYVLRRVDIVTTPSQYLGEALITSYGLDPKKVIPNYNASPLPDQDATISRQPFLVNYVGRLVPWKHLEGTIKAVATLQPEFPQLSLTIAGAGSERKKLETIVNEVGMQKHITFTGVLDREAVRKLMHTSTIHILNSSYEGLPHTALEAFSAGALLVATDIPGTRELARHEDTALTYSVHDQAALVSTLRRALTDTALREKITRNAKALVESEFTWERHLKTLKGFFNTDLDS